MPTTKTTKPADDWEKQLARSWPEPGKALQSPVPKDVVQKVRFMISERLQNYLDEFMLDGSPEEKRLLLEVLTVTRSHLGRTSRIPS
jgi:hypothetical protein